MTPTGIEIRRLEPADAAALAGFYNDLSAASKRTFRPIGEITTTEVCLEIAAGNLGPAPTKLDLVASRGQPESARDQIVGWSFIWNLDQADPVFGLAVADAYHGQGVGTQLMKAVIAWAQAQALPCVELTVVTDNTVAQHLYEKQGFVRYDEFVGKDGLPYYRMRRLNPRGG